MAKAHSPEYAVYGGLAPLGGHQWFVESVSEPGTWHTTVVPLDGSPAICDCKGWLNAGHCTMVDNQEHLLAIGEICQVVMQLLDLSHQLQLKLEEDGRYKLSDEEAYNARRLTRQADRLLSELEPPTS